MSERSTGVEKGVILGRSPDRVIDFATQEKPVELQRPHIFTYVAQGRIKTSDEVALASDGLGYCMALFEKGEGRLTALTHVEGGGIDGSVKKAVEQFAREQRRTKALIIRATESYPSSQLEDELGRIGIPFETIHIDVAQQHFAVAYRPATEELLFHDELRNKGYIFNWK
jgi:hypothetical protein